MSAQGGWPAILLALTLGMASSVAAQWPGEVAPGARVQVRLPEVQYQAGGSRGHLIRGLVTGLTPDTIYLAVTDSVGRLAIPRALIQRMDLSRGVPSRGQSAAQRGLLMGAIGALWFLFVAELDDEPDGLDEGDAMLIGAGTGAVMGSVLGALYPRERWKRVRLGGASGAGGAPAAALMLRVEF